MNQTLLKVENLEIELNNQVIVKNVSFELKKNETLAIIGPNGAGKTTLFRALLGLVAYKGTITWEKGVKIGYVPQKLDINRDLPLTVREFFTLKGNYSLAEIKQVLDYVGFGQNILKTKIGVLSGGELQRILISWGIIGNPDVLLFDEPTSGVDISAEQTIYSLLYSLQKKIGLTILLISHELEIVSKYATEVVCLNKETVCYGPPRSVLTSDHLNKLYGKDVAYYHHHHQKNK